jgi:DNA repair protein RecO (recombination protein O)
MAVVTTPAIILSALRYSETSKIVRLATRDHGVQSAIAKGALRPRSRFGAALQLLSEGVATLHVRDTRELHTLAAFDVGRVHIALAADLERYSAAMALAEFMLRFAPPDPHPESFDLLLEGLSALESAPPGLTAATGLRALWQLVASLGFAPATDVCVRDGTPLPPDGPLAFSTRDGGALCAACASGADATRLPAEGRAALEAMLDPSLPMPALDDLHARAHRRLLARFIRFHLGDNAELPALQFWERRTWEPA